MQGIVKRHLPDYGEGSAFFRAKASGGEANFSVCGDGNENLYMKCAVKQFTMWKLWSNLSLL
jgi:hypothetical protein